MFQPNHGSVSSLSLPQSLVYASGECANSLVMNGVFGFAMIFFTKALGLNPAWAGAAMSISVIWEAMLEPVVGHLSDHTRSRWGRRHPYMVIGGLLMAVCSYLIWFVPDSFRASPFSTLAYVVTVNLLLRTGLTLFFIPYMALGFELCTDYQGRARLQSIRQIFNMAANFAGPALAWSLFFRDQNGVQATHVPANYLHMGLVFAICTAACVLTVVIFTFHHHEDTRQMPQTSNTRWRQNFWLDMKQIFLDPYSRWVLIFIFIVCAGMVLVSSLQIFVYDDYMHFSAHQKSIAHGSTMVGMALGAFLSIGLVKKLDKRNTVLLGGLLSAGASLMLGLIFVTGLVPTDARCHFAGLEIPLALVLFVIFHAVYWLGNGIMLPIANSMMADVSEIHFLRTGIKKDGAYSSVFSLSMRLAISLSLFIAGYSLDAIGYQVPTGGAIIAQSPQAIWRLGLVTFVIGAVICLLSLLAIRRYPVTGELLKTKRREANNEARPI